MLAPVFSVVDVETTGVSPQRDRITEIALVTVREGALAESWSSLVNPGVQIPPEIQSLTGITDAMVAGAPAFSELAGEISQRLAEGVLVAHNVRFDYGFLKAEFARAGHAFSAKTLCTVRLSRALFPGEHHHSLDALIARHRLPGEGRHRALADARIALAFIDAVHRSLPAAEVEAAVRQLLQRPSLPSQLPADALARIPEEPGVYVFYGANRHALYVGKSGNLRERVGAHFSNDHRSERDLRLSRELSDIDFECTAGEIGALLREAELVRELLPAHNVRLRRKSSLVALTLDPETGRPRFLGQSRLDLEELSDWYGVFNSRRAARSALLELARERELCCKALGLENGGGACFALQLERCRGACIGAESPDAHRARTLDALAPWKIPDWPHAGPVAVRESRPFHEDLHLVDRWCYLGSVRTLDAALELARSAERRFDLEYYRILAGALRANDAPLELVPLAL